MLHKKSEETRNEKKSAAVNCLEKAKAIYKSVVQVRRRRME